MSVQCQLLCSKSLTEWDGVNMQIKLQFLLLLLFDSVVCSLICVLQTFQFQTIGGPLTMAQLEYNLPILILGSPPSISMSSQTVTATASKTVPSAPRVSIYKVLHTINFAVKVHRFLL